MQIKKDKKNNFTFFLQQENYFSKTTPIRILMVEDQMINRMIMKQYLDSDLIVIQLAENGRIVTEIFIPNTYDLILMDLRMPEMDGYKTAQWIRNQEKEKGKGNIPIIALSASATKQIRQIENQQGDRNTPIIALTASVTTEETNLSLDAGCTEILAKPLRKAKLFEILLKYYGTMKNNRKKHR